jgi:hypothetical protein
MPRQEKVNTKMKPAYIDLQNEDEFDWLAARGGNGGGGGGGGGKPSGPGGGGQTDTTVSYTYTSGTADEVDSEGNIQTDTFNIDVNFLGDGWTLEAMSAIASAADYLSRLITQGLPEDEGIDDLQINVSLSDIDTLGGTVALGRPTTVRSTDNVTADGLPVSGEIIFDINDVSALLELGTFDDLALHEMMHVLGFGTLWEVPGVRDMLSDPVFVPDLSTKNPKDGATVIEYVGGAKDADGGLPPVEAEGTIGHWDEATYGDELMTPVLNTSSNFMSQMTADSLKDLGYSIDDTVAEELVSAIDLNSSGYVIEDFTLIA